MKVLLSEGVNARLKIESRAQAEKASAASRCLNFIRSSRMWQAD
jgi:hypothetical protein